MKLESYMINYNGISLQEQTKKLLEENLAYSKEISESINKIKRYIVFGRIISIIYLILFIAPIILGIVFLPTFLQGAFSSYLPNTLNESSDSKNIGNDANQQEQGNFFDIYKNLLNSQSQ